MMSYSIRIKYKLLGRIWWAKESLPSWKMMKFYDIEHAKEWIKEHRKTMLKATDITILLPDGYEIPVDLSNYETIKVIEKEGTESIAFIEAKKAHPKSKQEEAGSDGHREAGEESPPRRASNVPSLCGGLERDEGGGRGGSPPPIIPQARTSPPKPRRVPSDKIKHKSSVPRLPLMDTHESRDRGKAGPYDPKQDGLKDISRPE